MRFVIRKHIPDSNGKVWFRTEPDDQLMERFDWADLDSALAELSDTLRAGDTIELVDDTEHKDVDPFARFSKKVWEGKPSEAKG